MAQMFLSPKDVSQQLADIGIKKAQAPIYELFFFGILAGMYIAFGAQAALTVLSGGTMDPGFAKFLAGSVFSVGLMLVLIPGAELFTGNILMTIGLIDSRFSTWKLLRNWLVVYIGNFVGSLILAYIVFGSGLLGNSAVGLTPIGIIAQKTAVMKVSLSFTEAFARGILCNMLVCLAVIMSLFSRSMTGKIFGIYFPVMVFVLCGYEHSIANMYFLPLGFMVNGAFAQNFWNIWHNLVPATLGNIVGGILIVVFHPKTQKKLFNP